MSKEKVKSIVEALLMASDKGLTVEEIISVIKDTDDAEVKDCINTLKEEYATTGRAFTLTEIAGRCRYTTLPEYINWITKMFEQTPERLTGPSLETLSILAYKQPITRAEIEAIRGVNVGGVIQTLLDKGLVRVKGRKDVPGRPLLYGTTEKFLEIFGLNSLDDLPLLKDFSESDLDFSKPYKNQIIENPSIQEIPENIPEETGTGDAS
ncbi:MAG: SMC-Scp complex subunit ScpB [Candidatus Omnitrophica bacterium]|nr:SMC-Scp complex subunit ScpB [Candidatus Omnitrophota bacterium]